MLLYLLFESSSGFGLFERVIADEMNITDLKVQSTSIFDLKRFSKIVKLKAFLPFTSAENALAQINAISEGDLTEFLGDWLVNSIPDKKAVLGVLDPALGSAIQETRGIKCLSNTLTKELIRGVRLHFTRYIKALRPTDLIQSQLGLGHSYSRSKVKFNVHRVDNMIIQSIALLDQLDKDLNTYIMRVREWYSWHFPELIQVVKDNTQYCKCVKFIKHKAVLNESHLEGLKAIVGDDLAPQVLQASRSSMGAELSEIDMVNIEDFADRVISLLDYRALLFKYLQERMDACAPNLTALLGEQVGARLIAHAGSLTNLAKYPASTVQILGAEKALFRALKTKGNTPKYGLIFHSSFIGRAATKNKGRISRYLANKCSLASRIDCFSDEPTDSYGLKLREQVEERLEFYKTGKPPRKNIDCMREVVVVPKVLPTSGAATGAADTAAPAADKKKKKKKRKAEATPEVAAAEPKKKKKKKKTKKA
jgi:nucleolar protein 56